MYTSLSASKREIRVLTIHPSQPPSEAFTFLLSQFSTLESPGIRVIRPGIPHTGIISCSTSVLSLLDNPPPCYEALSYVWGDASVTETIEVDGQPFQATKNLAAALAQLRESGQIRPIWIDAICIRQQDIEEKNQQVSMMSEIYRGATRTIAWLGVAINGDLRPRRARSLLKRWVECERSAIESSRSHPDYLEFFSNFPGIPTRLMRSIGDEMGAKLEAAFDMEEYKALIELVNSDYWKRAWITQEVCLSRDLILRWGPETIDWKTLSIGFMAISSSFINYGIDRVLSGEHLRAISSTRSNSLQSLDTLRKSYSVADKVRYRDIMALIDLNKNRTATLAVDRVFSLAGLLEPSEARNFEVDYSCSAEEIFTALTRKFIQNEPPDMAFLALIGVDPDGIMIDGLPSWVPNFANPSRTWGHESGFAISPLANERLIDYLPPTTTRKIIPKPSVPASRVFAEPSITDRQLSLNVIHKSRVSDVRHWLVRDAPEYEPLHTISSWLSLAFSTNTIHPTGLPTLQVFFRTLKRDRSGFGGCDPRFKDNFEEEAFCHYAVGFINIITVAWSFEFKTKMERLHSVYMRARGDDSDYSVGSGLVADGDEEGEEGEEEDDFDSFLQRFYDTKLRLLEESDAPEELQGFAHGLALSPLRLDTFDETSILETFCGNQSQSQSQSQYSIPVQTLRKHFDGGNKFGEFLKTFIWPSESRQDCFFVTDDGYMGLGHKDVAVGDEVCFVPGCSWPMVIRGVDSEESENKPERCRFIGTCYIYGAVEGEIWKDATEEDLRRVIFE